MTPPRHLVLTGFMGAGKSTVGPLLGRRLAVPFVDTDALIEKEVGLPIREIFAQKGEPFFRRAERRAVRAAGAGSPSVIAVGGGALGDVRNRSRLRSTSFIVYLAASAQTLQKRLRGGKDRPLLEERPAGTSAGERIRVLLRERAHLYRAADLIVRTDGLTPREVAERVLQALKRRRLTLAWTRVCNPPRRKH